MDLREFDSQSQQTRHPWELSRADFFLDVIRGRTEPTKPINALDVGSGDTWLAQRFLEKLPSGSTIVCVDNSYTPAVVAGLRIRNERLRLLPALPEDGSFDIAFLLDVLEHVPDDRDVLRAVAGSIKPGGLVVISVPAFQELFTAHDTWLQHFRRYSPEAGKRLVRDCGLELLEDGGLFHSLLYARAFEKLSACLGRRPAPTGISAWRGGSGLSRLVHSSLNGDWALTNVLRGWGIKLPGLSWWGVCRKSS